MVKIGDIYQGGNFLNAAKLKEQKLKGKKLTIDLAEVEEIRENEKLVLTFKETQLKLALNATNARIISEKYGDESDDWLGKVISLNAAKVDFQGKLVDSIQVEIPEE